MKIKHKCKECAKWSKYYAERSKDFAERSKRSKEFDEFKNNTIKKQD